MLLFGDIIIESPHIQRTLVIINYCLILERPERVEAADGQQLCAVCGDVANGVHFGVVSCEGCKVIVKFCSCYYFNFIK